MTAKILLGATQARAQAKKTDPILENHYQSSVLQKKEPEHSSLQKTKLEDISLQEEGRKNLFVKTNTSEWIAEGQVLHEVRNELQSIRDFLAAQMSGLAWQEFKRMKPMQVSLLRRFLGIGMESTTAMHLLKKVHEGSDLQIAWNEALSVLTEEIHLEEMNFRNTQDPIALIGMSGVGKTLTLVKVAALLKMRKQNALLCSCVTDGVSSNAALRSYARLLQIPFILINSKSEYLQVLKVHQKDKVILIDTPALDYRLSEKCFPWIALPDKPKTLLVLPASNQYTVLKKTIDLASQWMFSGIILSKTDETALLGESLSVLINSKLPLVYYTDGIKIPTSLKSPCLSELLEKLLSMPLNSVQPEMAWMCQQQGVV